MRKCICLLGLAVLILGWTLILAPRAEAYENYRDGGINCSQCHPGFVGGPSGPQTQTDSSKPG